MTHMENGAIRPTFHLHLKAREAREREVANAIELIADSKFGARCKKKLKAQNRQVQVFARPSLQIMNFRMENFRMGGPSSPSRLQEEAQGAARAGAGVCLTVTSNNEIPNGNAN